jgi:hypothetical protein
MDNKPCKNCGSYGGNVGCDVCGPPIRKRNAEERLALTTGSAWISIAERLPKVGKRVLVCCQYTDRRLVTIAKWQPAKTIDGQFWDDYPEEWEDDDGDTITNPTDLWVEYPLEIEQCGFVENVTHWMPLPSLPNREL